MQNLRIRKYIRDTQAITQLTLAPSFTKLGSELLCQFGNHLLTVFGTLPLQYFAVDASADLPIELGEFGIDYAGHPLPGGIDEMTNIGKQPVIGWNGASHISRCRTWQTIIRKYPVVRDLMTFGMVFKDELFKFLLRRWGELFNAKFDVLLYDLTSTYFESDTERGSEDLRQYGYSRDKRGDCRQVVIALIVTPEGFPLSYEVLAGNTADSTGLEQPSVERFQGPSVFLMSFVSRYRWYLSTDMLLAKRATKSMVVLIASLIVIDIFIIGAYFGVQKVLDRIEQTTMQTEDRDEIASDTFGMWKDYPVFGSGLGSFHVVFPRYSQQDLGALYTHTHNDYLEFASETGIVGISLLGVLVLSSLMAALRAQVARRDPLMRGLSFGAMMAIIALGMHSTVDANLQIPANALTFMLLLAFAWISLYHRYDGESQAEPGSRGGRRARPRYRFET